MKTIIQLVLASCAVLTMSSCQKLSMFKKQDPYAQQSYTQDPYGYAQQATVPQAPYGQQQQYPQQNQLAAYPTGEQAQVYPQNGGQSYAPTGTDNWQPTPEPTYEAASNSGSGSGRSYTVRRGDTMYGIARKHGTNPGKIANLNGISDPNQIRVGQRLRLP